MILSLSNHASAQPQNSKSEENEEVEARILLTRDSVGPFIKAAN
jgi:hypothetical protein